ncbi:hypothetical protein KGP17_11935 [Serratia sp. JSRIV001]|uniref:hypothetical protein n=1 Tax=Serratia TaxID=613 RepID=UPI001CC14F71|nr:MULTISPECIES: hypothetical protein [Serratia]UAN48181.1 hypothetical protein KGP17_11935 [Serratia sp. JSRIV001]CAI0936087.1 Uncharacterised protein [Serratia fonticola]
MMKIKQVLFICVLGYYSVFSVNVCAENKLESLDKEKHRKLEALGYRSFLPLNMEELDNTKGKVGPLVLGAIGAAGGAAGSIGIDLSNGAQINWGNAATAAVGGFVTGATGGLMGATVSGAAASAALGVSAMGATNAAIGGLGGGGRGSCDTCHKKK